MRLSIGSVVVVLVALKGRVCGLQVFCEKYYPMDGGWRFFTKPEALTCRLQKHGITFDAGITTADREV